MTFQLIHQRTCNGTTSCPKRMTKSNGTTIYIYFIMRHTRFFHKQHRYRSKSFIHFKQINIIKSHTCLFQGFFRCRSRTDKHNRRISTIDSRSTNFKTRFQTNSLSSFFITNQSYSRTIDNCRRITSMMNVIDFLYLRIFVNSYCVKTSHLSHHRKRWI